jgi:hypothetical protein
MYNNIEIRHLLSNTVAHELGTGMQRATICITQVIRKLVYIGAVVHRLYNSCYI